LEMKKLQTLILDSEEILIERILNYAKEHNYVKYTSTLKEAWRMSISGLSKALVRAIEISDAIPEMGPDEDFTKSEVAEFGIREAQKHRSRGITLGMFLGFVKYYHQGYVDLINESNFSPKEKKYFSQYIKRYFDYIELGFTIEWAGLSEKLKLKELQEANRELANEKNKYLTVFESSYDPIILVDKDNKVENINYKAAEVFLDIVISGIKYYGNVNTDNELAWLNEEFIKFIDLKRNEVVLRKTISTKTGQKIFLIKFKKMLDISEKYSGTVIIFNDITERIKIEQELKDQHEQLESYAFTDQMTGVSNRRTGLMTLEKELALVSKRDTSLAVCFIDVDGLKKVNDTYGHTEGDCLINFIAASIKSSISQIDAVSRMGGDEFLIIFPDCNETEAEKVIKRICYKLEEYDMKITKPIKCSFSYGILEITKDSKLSVNDIIKVADEKMYRNKLLKKTGRVCEGFRIPFLAI